MHALDDGLREGLRASEGALAEEALRVLALQEDFADHLLPMLAQAGVLLAVGHAVVRGDLTLGAFFAFNLLLMMLVAPLRMLGMWIGQAQRATASGERFFEIVDEPDFVATPQPPVILEPLIASRYISKIILVFGRKLEREGFFTKGRRTGCERQYHARFLGKFPPAALDFGPQTIGRRQIFRSDPCGVRPHLALKIMSH